MNQKPTIRDDELFAFLVDDELDAAQADAVRAALAREPALAARLATIADAWERVLAAPERDDLFEVRTWRAVAARLDVVGGAFGPDLRGGIGRGRTPLPQPRRTSVAFRRGFALAATVLVAVGVGFLAGRLGRDAAPPAAPLADTTLLAEDASRRVLAAHIAAHLESAERALLVASNSPEESETARALASELVEGNRLYAAAAERAGRPQLAEFLRQLEPVLLELANGDASTDALVAEQIRERDLAFKSRAAAALARRELGAGLRITL